MNLLMEKSGMSRSRSWQCREVTGGNPENCCELPPPHTSRACWNGVQGVAGSNPAVPIAQRISPATSSIVGLFLRPAPEGFDAQRGPYGPLLIGEPDEVAQRIMRHGEALGGISRITFQMNASSLPHAKLMRAIGVIGTRVAPALRHEL